MSNTFKVGDKVTVNAGLVGHAAHCSRDTTQNKSYTVLEVDTASCTEGEHDVRFIDDVGDEVHLYLRHLTLAKD